MTTDKTQLYPLTRRSMLKTAAAAGTVSAFGAFGSGFVGRAAADEHEIVINTCNDLDIALALDYSGSINGAGTWPDIQGGVESFFDVVPGDVQLGMVLFGDAPQAYEYASNDLMRLATAANVDMLQDAVPANSPPQENGTHMPGALEYADAILDNEGRGGNEVIILVTDGGPNYQNGVVGDGAFPPEDDTTFPYGSFEYTGGSAGGDGNITQSELDETETVATAIKDGGVRIITVGIGQNVAGFDDYLENNVASSPDDFVAVENAEDLGAQLQQLLTEICDECPECDFEGAYKFEYVVEYDDEGEVEFHGFAPDGDVEGFEFVSYTNKEGESYDPVTATFQSEYCADSLVATVKAGRYTEEFDVTTDEDGNLVVDITDASDALRNKRGKLHGISYIVFECVEDEE